MKRFLSGLVTAAIFSPLCVNSAVIGDINQDGKIDLMESIYALQVASGVYPTIEDSCLLTGQGAWGHGVDYNLCDVVTFSEQTYACTDAHTSSAGSIEPSNTEYWTLLSIQGETGPPGAAAAGQSCTPGGYVNGFDANGDIICQYPWKYVFITQGSYTGDLGGVAGADAKCQVEADAAGLPGTYKAWISTDSASPAEDFTKSPSRYILPDGKVVADSWDDLTDGTLDNRISVTAAGGSSIKMTWTNTRTSGHMYAEYYECQAWTDTVGSTDYSVAPVVSNRPGKVGSTTYSDSRWTYNGNASCAHSYGLYCFQQ